jgi:hypothetical protein
MFASTVCFSFLCLIIFSSEIFVEVVRGNVLGTENVRKWFLVAYTNLFHIVCSAIKQVRIYEDSCSSGSGKMKPTRIRNTALGCTDHCCGADIICSGSVYSKYRVLLNFIFVTKNLNTLRSNIVDDPALLKFVF